MSDFPDVTVALTKYYKYFETIVLLLLLLMVGVMITYALIIAATQLYADLSWQASYVDSTVLKDTFSLLLSVVILIEFNHSLLLAIVHKNIDAQIRPIILIGILVVLRKLMLFDLGSADIRAVSIFGVIPLALGILYWILGDADRRRANNSRRTNDVLPS